MGCFNTLFLLLLGGIYLFWPEMMDIDGFGLVSLQYGYVFCILGVIRRIADEISGVNNIKTKLLMVSS